jgi:hypothetical protein
VTNGHGSDNDDQGGRTFETNVGGDAKVGAVGGIIIGDVHAHFGDEETPKGRFKAAIAFLESGAGTTAARLIRRAVEAGFTGDDEIPQNQVAYYWVLAILSGRAYEQLVSDDFEAFERARSMTNRAAPDVWLVPHDVICKLFESLRRQQEDDARDPAFGQVLNDYLGLAPRFQEDVQRHLDLMLAGGIYDNLEATVAAQASAQRMSSDRAGRAWKFFEQEPRRPRERTITEPSFPLGGRALAGLGTALLLLALVPVVGALRRTDLIWAVLLIAIVLICGLTAATAWIVHSAAAERLADKEGDFGQKHLSRYAIPPLPAAGGDGLPDDSEDLDEADRTRSLRDNRKRFARMVVRHLNEQFRDRAPNAPGARRRWDDATRGLKASLKDEVLGQYNESDIAPGALNWLITARVGEIAKAWRAGTLHDFRKDMQPSPRHVLLTAAGVVVGSLALVYALVLAGFKEPIWAIISVILLVIAGSALVVSRLDVHLVHRQRLHADKEDAAARHAADQAAYEHWVEQLRDRPSDAEMARWLDFDRLHLKKVIMSQLGLASRDILSHATLTEPAPNCILARMPHLPPRATAYRVTVFLLTRAGVRQVETKLDFRNGEAYDQVRRSFRYDVIMSSQVHEIGVRYDTGRRQAMPPLKSPWTIGENTSSAVVRSEDRNRFTATGSVILRQYFRLSLGNREQITFLVENLEDVWGRLSEEDPLTLLDLALDTSGIAAALEILEAISGHGAQWVEERIRRRRRWSTAEHAHL